MQSATGDTPGDRRRRLVARIAASRADLLATLVGLDERTLTSLPLIGDWTARDVLAHIAAWDDDAALRIQRALAGREADLVRGDAVERNAATARESATLTFGQALDRFVSARTRYLIAFDDLSDEDLELPRQFPWGVQSLVVTAEWRYRHDDDHGGEIAASLDRLTPARGVGPRTLLLAALAAARQDLLATATIVAPSKRTTHLVHEGWTVLDVVGHLADWERLWLERLRQHLAGQEATNPFSGKIDEWNAANAAARAGQTWEYLMADFSGTHGALLEIVDSLTDAELARPFAGHPGTQDSAYRAAQFVVNHDRRHAAAMREWLGLSGK